MGKSMDNNQNENKKVITKYDKKVQKRKEEARKSARNKKIFKTAAATIAAAAVLGGSFAGWSNYNKIHNEYISVDNDKISEIDFDFYYAMTKQNTLSQTLYGSMTYKSYFESYMGYDSSKDDSKQKYSSTDNTWYDYFANMTLDSIKEDKALIKAADANGYSYDTVEDDYNSFISQVSDAAQEQGISVKDYYKENFGSHATEADLKDCIYTYLKAAAYQKQLQTDLAATDEEIKDYYSDNKDTYDTVDYREFIIASENGDDETALKAAKDKADKMKAAITDEDSFAELCRENATDDKKETYESDTASLKSAEGKSSSTAVLSDWLYDKTRVKGDSTVIEDTQNNQYYVVYFVNRSYDSSKDSTIGNTVLSNKYSELINGYKDGMSVKNKNNRIKMYTE